METWASHRATRHFWGFSELQDFDPECTSSTSAHDLVDYVDTCKDILHTMQERDHGHTMGPFFYKYYGVTEGGRDRSNDAGWMCAQRRPGRAFGWLHSQYVGGDTTIALPDYLLLVDDDTHVNMGSVMSFVEGVENEFGGSDAFGVAGCVFQRGEE